MNNAPSPTTGGIIWKNVSGHQKIAIVRTNGAENGWSLPVVAPEEEYFSSKDPFKEIGKLVGREVINPVSAESLFYPEWDPPGFVIFWHLQVKPNGKQVKTSESDVKWCTQLEASKRLSSRAERDLIKRVKFPSAAYTYNRQNTTIHDDLTTSRSVKMKSSAYERLEGDLKAFSAELEYIIRKNTLEDGTIPAWGDQAGTLVNMAADQLRRKKLDPAWKSLHAAKRLALHGLEEHEVPKMAMRIRHESINLNKWRRKSVYQLLGENHPSSEPIDNTSLYLAAQIRDEHFSNTYYKNALTRSVINTLMLLLSVTVVLLFAYLAYVSHMVSGPLISDVGGERSVALLPLMTGMLLFGIFGGCMSSLFKVKNVPGTLRNPELINSHFFTTVRVFTGGAAAVAIFIFLESEFADLAIQNFTLQPSSHFTYFVIAFICGFSERLLLKAVSSISNRE